MPDVIDFTPVPAGTGAHEQPQPFKPFVNWLIIGLCVILFVGLEAGERTDRIFWMLGYRSVAEIRGGAVWALLVSAFLHGSPLHIFFNMSWIKVIGSSLEETVGHVRYAVFYIAAAMISSLAQVIFSGETGIGASGVVYAIFGFMWLARGRYPQFRQLLDGRTINYFIGWLFFCFILTYMNILPIGNAAHVSGLLFGAAIGFVVGRRKDNRSKL